MVGETNLLLDSPVAGHRLCATSGNQTATTSLSDVNHDDDMASSHDHGVSTRPGAHHPRVGSTRQHDPRHPFEHEGYHQAMVRRPIIVGIALTVLVGGAVLWSVARLPDDSQLTAVDRETGTQLWTKSLERSGAQWVWQEEDQLVVFACFNGHVALRSTRRVARSLNADLTKVSAVGTRATSKGRQSRREPLGRARSACRPPRN